MDTMGDVVDTSEASDVLWRHPQPASTPMWHFIQHVNERHGLKLQGYPDLYRWSVDNVSAFWEETWDFVGIVASQKAHRVCPPCPTSFPSQALLVCCPWPRRNICPWRQTSGWLTGLTLLSL